MDTTVPAAEDRHELEDATLTVDPVRDMTRAPEARPGSPGTPVGSGRVPVGVAVQTTTSGGVAVAMAGAGGVLLAGAAASMLVVRSFRRRASAAEQTEAQVPAVEQAEDGNDRDGAERPADAGAEVDPHAPLERDLDTAEQSSAGAEPEFPEMLEDEVRENPSRELVAPLGVAESLVAERADQPERVFVQGERIFERRRKPRVAVSIEGRLQWRDDVWPLTVVDLSEAGLRCCLAGRDGVGTRLPAARDYARIAFPLDGQLVAVSGQVAWRRDGSEGTELGLQFSGLPEPVLQRIRTACDTGVPVA